MPVALSLAGLTTNTERFRYRSQWPASLEARVTARTSKLVLLATFPGATVPQRRQALLIASTHRFFKEPILSAHSRNTLKS